jgi:hypothetical protein
MIGQTPQQAPREDVTDATDAVGSNSADIPADTGATNPPGPSPEAAPKEWGGREGPEPTRYGDWEKNGRCIDF